MPSMTQEMKEKLNVSVETVEAMIVREFDAKQAASNEIPGLNDQISVASVTEEPPQRRDNLVRILKSHFDFITSIQSIAGWFSVLDAIRRGFMKNMYCAK